MPTATLSTNKNPIPAQLVSTLELAANEMRAAEAATTLDEAKVHAETVVNVLVGKYGRWYGDQNGDNQVKDPSDKRGVLPGEKIPVSGGADIDTNAQFPYGLALMAIGTQSSSPSLQNLLGDVALWRTRARGGYDSIASAIAQNDVATLQGTVPRSVAYARFILTTAQTLEHAHQYATAGVQEMESAIQSARTLAQ